MAIVHVRELAPHPTGDWVQLDDYREEDATNEVTRWAIDHVGELAPHPTGDWVQLDDYREEVERLKALIVLQHEVLHWPDPLCPLVMKDEDDRAIKAIVQEWERVLREAIVQEAQGREAAAKVENLKTPVTGGEET